MTTVSGLLRDGSCRGVALVLVLFSLVIMAVLIVGFLMEAGTERKTAADYLASSQTQRLSETAVNMVEAEITAATTQGAGYSWASQPGAIWVFQPAASGTTVYRLYSWNPQTTANPSDVITTDTSAMANWANSPAVWVDLNAPAVSTSGTTVYPIVDPTAVVDGFSITTAGLPASSGSASMPVQWLYALQDGEFATPDAESNGKIVTFQNAKLQHAVSSTNPIVGRIAYWTDDETCKINVNTASYCDNGSQLNPTYSQWISGFWDTPRFNSDVEHSFATYQPVNGEYQRYPGHPAAISLSGVFQNLSESQIFGMVPREVDGGSMQGKVPYYSGALVTGTSKSDRLYASTDDFMFTAQRTPNPPAFTSGTGVLSPSQVSTGRFFLTSHSRAPELNLYGMPRVSVWPVNNQNNSSYRTTEDQLLAYCSTETTGTAPTSGTDPYYFTRQESWNSNYDISLPRNQQLLTYLDDLTQTPIPGYGGTFGGPSGKYPSDCRQILTEMFDYVRCTNLMDCQLSGSNDYAGAYDAPPANQGWGTCQVAPSIAGAATPVTNWNTQGFGGHFYIPNEVAIQFCAVGTGSSTNSTASPIPPQHLFYNGTQTLKAPVDPSIVVSGSGGVVPPNCTAVQAFFLVSFVNPGAGFPSANPSLASSFKDCFWMEIDAPQLLANGSAIFTSTSMVTYVPETNYGGAGGTGYERTSVVYQMDFSTLLFDPTRLLIQAPGQGFTDYTRIYPFYSSIFAVNNANNAKLNFGGGPIQVKIYCGQPQSPLAQTPQVTSPPPQSTLVQTININFPAAALPIPTLISGWPGTYNSIGNGQEASQDRWAEISSANATIAAPIEPGDTVQSMVLANGDARLLAQANVPSSAFIPHPDSYLSSSNATQLQIAHSFYGGLNSPLLGATTRGGLAPGVTNYGQVPVVPPNVTGTYPTSNGALDWDNGVGNLPDGPWINQPDEGNISNTNNNEDAYYDTSHTASSFSFFSPNRMIPSPGMFGSLPTGVISGKPWQTLLFRPGPPGHIGSTAPEDELFLDLFWMPTVEPYAISDQFSTAGKVNLNQGIVPFTYITRQTALRAAINSQRVAIMNSALASIYKSGSVFDSSVGTRAPVNLDPNTGTFRQINAKFASGQIFKSAAEICDIYLVPQGDSWASDAAAQAAWYGANFALVGDNTRERPYANLYGMLTTKSNTFRVYYTVEALKEGSADLALGQWNETHGSVTSQQRGSTVIERYIDPANNNIPYDYAAQASEANPTTALSGLQNMEGSYRWHVLENRQFVP